MESLHPEPDLAQAADRAVRTRICCQPCPWGACAEGEVGQPQRKVSVHLPPSPQQDRDDLKVTTPVLPEEAGLLKTQQQVPSRESEQRGAEPADVILYPQTAPLGLGSLRLCVLLRVTPWAGAATACPAQICDSTLTFLRRDNVIAHTWLPPTARLSDCLRD